MARRTPGTPRTGLLPTLLALAALAVPVVLLPAAAGPAAAAPTFVDPEPGTVTAPTVLTVDPSGVPTAVLTVTNPSLVNGAGIELSDLTAFEWSSISGGCASVAPLPTSDPVSIAIDPGADCVISARVTAPAAPGATVEDLVYALAYEIDSGDLEGHYTLRADTPVPPPPPTPTNDEVAAATDISSLSIPVFAGGPAGPSTVSAVNGTTAGSGFDADEIDGGFDADATGSVWFRYAATTAFEGRLGYRSATSGVSVFPWIARTGVTAPATFGDLRYGTYNVTAPWNLPFVRVEAGQTVWFQVVQSSTGTPGPFTIEFFRTPAPNEDVALAYDAWNGTDATVPTNGSETGLFGDGDTYHTAGDDVGDGSAVVWTTLRFGQDVTFRGQVSSVTSAVTGSTRPLRVRIYRAPSTDRVTTPAALGAPIATVDSVLGAGVAFVAGTAHTAVIPPMLLTTGRYYFAVSTSPSQPTIFFDSYRWSAAGPGDTMPPTVTIIEPVDGATFEVADVPVAVWFDSSDDSGAAPSCTTTPPTPPTAPGQHTITVRCTDAAGNAGSDSASYTVLTPRVDLQLRWLTTTDIVVGEVGDLTLELSTTTPATPTTPAVDASVRVDLPEGIELVGPVPAGFDRATGVWSPGPVGGTQPSARELALRVRMSATGSTTVGAEIVSASSPDPDSTPGNGIAAGEDDDDTSTLVRTSKQADLAVSLTGPIPVVARPGAADTAEISIGNSGPNPATAVVRVRLDQMTLDTSAPMPSSFDPATGDWTVTVAASGNETIVLPIRFGGPVVNRITAEVIASDALDPDSTPANGTTAAGAGEDDIRSFAVLPVAFSADLDLRASTLASLLPGETGTVRLDLQNAGPDTSTGARVRIVVPAGLELVGPAPAGFDTTTGIWNVGAIAAATGGPSLELTVRMLPAGPTTVTGEVIGADVSDPDSTPGNGTTGAAATEDDHDSVTVPRVTPFADLAMAGQVSLLATAVPVAVGGDVDGSLGVGNAGPQDTVAQVRITLDGLALRSGAPLPAGFSAATGIWTIPVPAGSTQLLSLPLVATRGGTLALTGEVITSTIGDPDSTPGNGTVGAAATEDDHASGTIAAAAPMSRFALQYSSSARRTAPLPLDGATVSGGIAVFVPAAADVTRVEFFLNDPTASGGPRQVERFAPYDFAGTGGGNTATLFSTRTLADGPHTITARVVLRNGTSQLVTSTFTVSNPRPATRQLLVSSQSTRAGALPLDGRSVSGRVAVFVPDESGIARVEFRVDGRLVQTERFRPYDLGGTLGNGRAALVRFAPGTRTVTARIVFTDGTSDTIQATFTAS